MAAFGSQINPALGRVDYTPFLQGAQMAAAGRQRGTEMLQQGISQGFEDYLKKREQNAILEGRNASIVRAFTQDPSLKQFAPDQKSLDSLMAKMAKGGGLTLNDNIKLNAELQTTVDLAEKAREAQRQQAFAEQARASVNQMAYNLDQAKKSDEAWNRWADLSRGFTKDTTLEDREVAAAKAGLSPEAASRVLGTAINAEQLKLARDRAALEKRVAEDELEKKKADSDFLRKVRSGEEPGFTITVDRNTGTQVLTDTARGVSTQITPSKPAPLSQGEKLRAEAFKFHSAMAAGDTAGAAEAISNARKLTSGQAFENYEDYEFSEKVFGPFRGDLRASLEGPSTPLEVKGTPRPTSPKPSATAEDQRITEQPDISGKSFYQMGTPFKAAGGVVGRTYNDQEVAEQQRRSEAAMGSLAPQAPAAPPQAPRPPVQDIVIPQDTRPPVQDIILDDAFIRRGSKDELPAPGQKYITNKQYQTLKKMEEDLQLSKSATKLLEPKTSDSPNTLALKKVLPYLPNRALSERLLKELSQGKEPSLSLLEKDPVARSMLAAAKEGRLPQLNMATLGRS